MLIKLSEYGQSLGTRQMAQEIRKKIMSNVSEKTVLDFTDVSIISNSFADELLGIIIRDYGYEKFKQTVQFQGTNVDVKNTIIKAIACRIQ